MADRDRLTAIVFEALDLDGRRDRDHELAAEVVDKLLALLDDGAAPGELQQMRSVIKEARELAEGWAKSEDRGWISPLGDELLDVLGQTSARLAALQKPAGDRPSSHFTIEADGTVVDHRPFLQRGLDNRG